MMSGDCLLIAKADGGFDLLKLAPNGTRHPVYHNITDHHVACAWPGQGWRRTGARCTTRTNLNPTPPSGSALANPQPSAIAVKRWLCRAATRFARVALSDLGKRSRDALIRLHQEQFAPAIEVLSRNAHVDVLTELRAELQLHEDIRAAMARLMDRDYSGAVASLNRLDRANPEASAAIERAKAIALDNVETDLMAVLRSSGLRELEVFAVRLESTSVEAGRWTSRSRC
jgi:hypothetical protein